MKPYLFILKNFAIAGGVFLLDQLTKAIALRFFVEPQLKDFGFIRAGFQVSYNEVFALSIPASKWVVLGVVLPIFLLAAAYWARAIRFQKSEAVPLSIIIGGALGNLLDRFFHLGVIDWIEWSLFNLTWSSINLADVAIVMGVLWWIWIESTKKRIG